MGASPLCNRCGECDPARFYKRNGRRREICKACYSAYQVAWQQKKREKQRAAAAPTGSQLVTKKDPPRPAPAPSAIVRPVVRKASASHRDLLQVFAAELIAELRAYRALVQTYRDEQQDPALVAALGICICRIESKAERSLRQKAPVVSAQ